MSTIYSIRIHPQQASTYSSELLRRGLRPQTVQCNADENLWKVRNPGGVIRSQVMDGKISLMVGNRIWLDVPDPLVLRADKIEKNVLTALGQAEKESPFIDTDRLIIRWQLTGRPAQYTEVAGISDSILRKNGGVAILSGKIKNMPLVMETSHKMTLQHLTAELIKVLDAEA
ncbi:MAG: hypothetical protein WCV91_02480 [Candidatus Margulisiibacteriota bacterium]